VISKEKGQKSDQREERGLTGAKGVRGSEEEEEKEGGGGGGGALRWKCG